MMNLIRLGEKLYDCRRKINYRCVLVFMVRTFLYRHELSDMERFFSLSSFRREFFAARPQLCAQLTRQFFFRGSKAEERRRIIVETFAALEQRFGQAALEQIYLPDRQPLVLWSADYAGKPLTVEMFFCLGEIREGAMTLALSLEGKFIYHVNFWIWQENGQPVIYIGCHQGTRQGLGINKALTKYFFGCRPKNLIITILQILAGCWQIDKIKAVSDYGFYANNHLRRDRKLRTSYDDFWRELGGQPDKDRRFFLLPHSESRKNMTEVPTRKRAVYRRRFAFLDELYAELQASYEAARRDDQSGEMNDEILIS